jgi:hypothetical protein
VDEAAVKVPGGGLGKAGTVKEQTLDQDKLIIND